MHIMRNGFNKIKNAKFLKFMPDLLMALFTFLYLIVNIKH